MDESRMNESRMNESKMNESKMNESRMNVLPMENYINMGEDEITSIKAEKVKMYPATSSWWQGVKDISPFHIHYTVFKKIYPNMDKLYNHIGMINGEIAYSFFVVHHTL